jgi:hypothetical protein
MGSLRRNSDILVGQSFGVSGGSGSSFIRDNVAGPGLHRSIFIII